MTMLDCGAVIGRRYRLREVIGIGSTGTVWDGHDLASDVPVAVKVLHRGLFASPAARTRFGREAAAARSLTHPNWMRIESDGVTDDGRP
jgi:serine/threonine protein kinase